MASLISYTRMIPVAAVAAAADLYFNKGRVVSTVALGALGGLIVKGCLSLPSLFSDKVTRFQDFIDPVKNQKAVSIAVECFQKDFPQEYQTVVKSEKLFSEEDILKFFTQRLSKGCCAGTADALFSKIINKQSHSLDESERLLKSEDVFYQQILVTLLQEDIGRGSDRHLEKLSKGIHYGFFTDSERFSLTGSPSTYQLALENAMLRFPKSQDFMGVLHLPQHVLSFQYGPKGYYFMDPMNPEAHVVRYTDRENFFHDLPAYAMQDSEFVISLGVKNEMEGARSEVIREETAQRVSKREISFSINPL